MLALPVTWGSGAAAAPLFVGAPVDVTVASAAWDAAVACTGRQGAALDEVVIERKTVAGNYLGVARTDPAGRLYRIDLNASDARLSEVVVHEVSHAWVSDGPVALVEGTAELIADCVVEHLPGLAPLQYDDGRDLSGLPDLLTWSKPVEGVPTELHAVRTDAYLGAARLLRTARIAAPDASWWADRRVDWAGFEAALVAAGPRGEALVAALHGGVEAQRAALADVDRDGLTALAESWLGTDDTRVDTDADGWSDPAVLGVPVGAVEVPLDATPVCTGTVAEPRPSSREADPAVVVGGNLRGAWLPPVVSRRASGDGPRPVLVALARSPGVDTTGAPWVVAPAGAAATGCRSTARVTVWAEDPAFDGRVAGFAAAVEAAVARADARLGLGPERVAVALGGAHTEVAAFEPASDAEPGVVVWLASRDVAAAIASGTTDRLALTAVTARRAWADGEPDWAGAEAVARYLAQGP